MLADLRSNKARTVLVVLSIAVGVFAIGMVGGSNIMMADALHTTYRTTNPASAQITTVDPFGDELLEAIARMRVVGEAEGRRVVIVRVQTGAGRWRIATAAVIFQRTGESGHPPAADRAATPLG